MKSGRYTRDDWFRYEKLGLSLIRTMLWLSLPMAGSSLPAAEDPRAAAPVSLPPMLVEETISTVPWLHVRVGGTEFLSRCSPSATRQFVEAVLTRQQYVKALVPPEFLATSDVPAVCILYAQDLEQTVSAEIQRELQRTPAGEERARAGDASRHDGLKIAPNMRLGDRDMHATIVYLDESMFEGSTLRLAPGYVRDQVQRRVPEPPAWLADGIERTWRRMDFAAEHITVRPMIWDTQRESDTLAGDAAHPRAVLPARELFADGLARASENQHPRRVRIRASTQELFVRWAVLSGRATRAALWEFAGRAAEGPVTEEMFESCFGFDFSELRDRLSDYLPDAVRRMERIDPGRLPPLPPLEMKRATPNEIARVRGEWERLAIGHVQKWLPEAREPYIAQARRTLRRAFDAGDRDPRLLATMGLCEIDAGNDAGAREFLEPAVAAGVVRPRACYELARLRFAELQRAAPDGKSFSFGELAPIFDPLRRALAQAPALPEVFVLLAEAWAGCETPPNTNEFAELERGARLFVRRPAVGYAIALAFARHGRKAEAAAVLATTDDFVTDEDTRAGITRLRAELPSEPAQPAGEQR